MIPVPRERPWHGFLRWFAGTAAGTAVASRIMRPLDAFLIRRTGGRHSLGGSLGGLPIITLTTTGRRSGQPRSVPLIGVPSGGDLVLIASNWARREYPAWYLNLKAQPLATVSAGGVTAAVVARETTGAEREACWRLAVALYPGYAAYQARVRGREIPVLLLTRLEEDQDAAADAA